MSRETTVFAALGAVTWLLQQGAVAATPVAVAVNPHAAQDIAAVNNLQPGEWYEVVGSRLRAIDPCPARNCAYSGSTNQGSVMTSWSGATYDPVHDALLVHGGGHSNYGGNEVYAFNVNTMQWERLTNPTPAPIANAAWFPDGTPNSSHSYDNLEFVPDLNAFCVFGNGSRWSDGGTNPSLACFDLANYTWVRKSDIVRGSGSVSPAIGGKSAFDPVTRSVWRHAAGGNSNLQRYDSALDTWHQYGAASTESGWVTYLTTAAIDPVRRLFIAVGGHEVRVWDMTHNPSAGVVRSTTGASAIVDKNNPGVEYDPVLNKIVAWAGGTTVYVLDTTTWDWTTAPIAPTNQVVPTAQPSNGTFGRFRYIPSKNAYIAVNSVDGDVYFFRLTSLPDSVFANGFEP